MDVTAKLLRVFRVEKQLRGLQGRLHAAEKFLAEQEKDLAGLDSRRATLDQQARALTAQASEREGECKRLDARMAALRTQMESAQTNKAYQAFLTELNNFKADRDKIETGAIELMQKLDEIKKQLAEIDAQRDERGKVKGVAANDRNDRFREIEARVMELKGQRDTAAQDLPPDALQMLNRLLNQRGDDAMAAVEIADRKRHEYTCGACQMSIPIDAVSALLSKGKLTLCASCQCILYLDEDSTKALTPSKK